LALGKKPLEGPLVFLIGARFIHLIGLSQLSYVEEINLLLEGYDLGYHVLGIVVITNTRGG
jgi:hypothetical protein